jgi:hypothetical protein
VNCPECEVTRVVFRACLDLFVRVFGCVFVSQSSFVAVRAPIYVPDCLFRVSLGLTRSNFNQKRLRFTPGKSESRTLPAFVVL